MPPDRVPGRRAAARRAWGAHWIRQRQFDGHGAAMQRGSRFRSLRRYRDFGAGAARERRGGAARGAAGHGRRGGKRVAAGGRVAVGGEPASGASRRTRISARCSFGVMSLSAPRSRRCPGVSMMIMTTPTMARRALTARNSTAERESPRSKATTGAALRFDERFDALADGVVLVRTHRAFGQPQHVALFVVQAIRRGCASARCAARIFWQTASKSMSGLSDALKGLPCSIDPPL